MKRRVVLGLLSLGACSFAVARLWPDEGFINPCPAEPMPDSLRRHELVQAAWEGIDPALTWDCHVHVVGVGDSGSGLWISPRMQSFRHPVEYVKRAFFQNSGCATRAGHVDNDFFERLLRLHGDFPVGAKFVLMAFDHYHDEAGRRVPERSAYHAPNDHVRAMALRHPDRFEWIASIHPYRTDAVEQLEAAARARARGVKWLPPAMGIDPASRRCDRFYETLARLKLPLLTHAGDEAAVHGAEAQQLGNPLRLRRALDHGVRVIVAHCATLGDAVDLDRGDTGPRSENFTLFARLMDEPRYAELLVGDISAVTQVNRAGPALARLLERGDWHARLINGSDYPLPGVMPLFSPTQLVDLGLLAANEARPLSEIRRYNPLLFDFVLKRRLRAGTARFAPAVFESRRVLDPARSAVKKKGGA
jgi:uncharacterized protein